MTPDPLTPSPDSPTPRSDKFFDFVEALSDAQSKLQLYPLFQTFVDGTPLVNDVPVWMAEWFCKGADFARQLERELATLTQKHNAERDELSATVKTLKSVLRSDEVQLNREKYKTLGAVGCLMKYLKEIDALRAQLAETHKQLTDQLCDNNQLIAEKVNQGAELLALQAHVGECRSVLKLVDATNERAYTAALKLLSYPPDLALIEEVREVLENVRGFEVIGERCRKRIDSILARLNPAKL